MLLRVTEPTADGAKSHLWLIETAAAGGEPRQVTYSPDSDKRGESSGAWMPDGGSILFLAKRGEHRQLFRLPMNGGEAKPFDLKVTPAADESKRPGALPPAAVTPDGDKAGDGKAGDSKPERLEIDVADYSVSPDGKSIAVLASDPQTPGEKKQKDAKADANWVDHELHGTRLYLLEVASGKLTQVSVPTDVRGAWWSEDSARLAVVSEEPNGIGDLREAGSGWMVEAADPGHATRLTEIPASVGGLEWAHDGRSLYVTAQAKRDAPPGYADVYQLTFSSRELRDLSDGYMGSIRGGAIALRDGGLLQPVEEGLETGLLRLPAAGGTGEGSARMKLPFSSLGGAATNAAQNAWAFLGNRGDAPTQLVFSTSLEETPRVLKTPPIAPKDLRYVAPKRISWKSDGFTIDGLLYLPPEAAAHKVPLVVEVHGGPTGGYADSFAPFDQYLLGQGWAVLLSNPRGSTGRGAAFAAANKNDLGGGDYRDIMAGVDTVLKSEPVDGSRMALMGYSYGGEMAGFAETKTTRFKAIVSMAPVIDQNSEYGTERGARYDRWFYGRPWEHPADAWRQSPLAGAAKAKTPFLLLQGESDTTDPLGQAQEMYRALRETGVTVELVTYPRVDHGPLGGAIYGSPSNEPWHGFDARRRIVEFVKKGFGEAVQ